MELAAGTGGEPFRVEIASLARPQLDEWAIDLGFEINGNSIAAGSERRFALGIESRLGTVHPKNHRSLAGIGLVLFVAEALDHGIAAVAIDHREPAGRRIEPQFGGEVRVVEREETVVPDGDRWILRWAEAHVVTVEI